MAILSKTGTFARYYLLWTFIVLSLAFPAELSSSSNAAEFSNFLPPNPFSKSVETRYPIANGATLRVLCLGASIMGGSLSTDKNGMRYALRSALAAHGNKVNMIGSIDLGTMDDNKVEAWTGYRIEQVAKKAELSLSKLPNVVAILAGTNDAGQGFDTPNMANRMATLIDRIFAVATGTTIILGTLPPMYEPADDIVRQYNSDLADLVSKRSAAGQKIFLVDMHSPWWSLADLSGDKVHPTDAGYLKMARVFYDGIIAANNSITPPKTPPGGISDHNLPHVIGHGPTAIDKTSGSTIGPIQTLRGSPPASSSASTLSTNQPKSIASQSTPYPTTVTARLASSSDSGISYSITVTTRSSSRSSSCQDSLNGCLTSPGANLPSSLASFTASQGSSYPTTVTTVSSEFSSCQDSSNGCLTSLGASLSSSLANFTATQGNSYPTAVTMHPASSGSSYPITVTTRPAPTSESSSCQDSLNGCLTSLGASLSSSLANFTATQGNSYPTAVTTHPASSLESGSSYPISVTTRPAPTSESSSCQDSLSNCLTSPGANLSTCQANLAACQGSLGFTQSTVVGTNSTSGLPSATTSKTAIFSGAASLAKPAAKFLALGALAFF